MNCPNNELPQQRIAPTTNCPNNELPQQRIAPTKKTIKGEDTMAQHQQNAAMECSEANKNAWRTTMKTFELSYEKIAKSLGVSKTQVYNHFNNTNGGLNPYLCKQIYEHLVQVVGMPEKDIPPHIKKHRMVAMPTKILKGNEGYFSFLEEYNLTTNPFEDDLDNPQSVYYSKDVSKALALLRGAVDASRMISIVAPTGFGKSVIKSLFIERLKRESNVRIVIPDILDQEKLTINHVTAALWYALVDKEKYPARDKTARENKLKDALERGKTKRVVVIIDEAHTIPDQTLAALKRLLEWSDGMKRYFSIILIGQEGLGHTFSMPMMREVSSRTRILPLEGFSDTSDLKSYLSKRFEQVGCEVDHFFDPDGLEALANRIKAPLALNRVCELCMERAAKLGQTKVNAEIVSMITGG